MIYSSKGIFSGIVIFSFVFLFSCETERSESVSPSRELNSAQTETPQSPTLSASDLRVVALNGNIEIVQNAIEQGMDNQEPDELGRTALMFAAYNGHIDIVQLLAENDSEINQSNSEGRTPLMFASSGPFPKTVEFLLTKGAAPNAKDEVEGWTSLMYAAAEGNREVVEILLESGRYKS